MSAERIADTRAHDAPRLVLMTTGLRPLTRAFATLPGRPVGIIDWDRHASRASSHRRAWYNALRRQLRRLLRQAWACCRGRRYTDLASLCRQQNLHHATIDTRDVQGLQRCLEEWRCDLLITSGCAMVPMRALRGLSHGAINLHPSLLPAWRGADPIFWQVQAVDEPFGVTVHRLAARADAGAIVAQRASAYRDGLSRQALLEHLEGDIGVPLMRDAIAALLAQPTLGEPQPVDSPTETANRPQPDWFEDRFALSALTPRQAWNIARCLCVAPRAWWAPGSAVSRTRWRPLVHRGRQSDELPGSHWTVQRLGPFGCLAHPGGTLWFIRLPRRR